MAGIITDLTDGIRRLQKLNKEMSELELKEEIFNLRQLLMDAKEALMSAQETKRDLEQKIKDLTSGKKCSICNEGNMKVIGVIPHPIFGPVGDQLRIVQCDKCNHKEEIRFKPSGA
ncbi:hypothetical protein [Paenirhodobacter populi]|uniref:Uncharacterized protein n=1 Tax=Paenirhodobacter populi TaxID=2306993 RepID=A0A443J1L1_9RHOB|nr:hypothetical protein [Sinirhodobacter populi]RWR14309.1 hypothetical protein D2T33_03600 [Sinirhodobacter populi]